MNNIEYADEEIWKKIEFANNYSVSNMGRIRMDGKTIVDTKGVFRTYKPHMCKFKIGKSGYCEIILRDSNKKKIYCLVHRLVLETFNPIDNMKSLQVNHKDENKLNNKLNNLEWMTPKENCNYGTRNDKVSCNKEIKIMCVETGIVYNSFHEAHRSTGIDVSSINMCCTGYRNRKTAGGYHWKYL